MNRINNILIFFGVFSLLLTGCQDDDAEFGDIVAPTNVTISVDIVGVDANNPNGDGTGFVNFTASADNALTYTYVFGDGTDDEPAPNGNIQHRFTQTGDITYNVTVLAYGAGGVSSSTSVEITVYSSFEDEEAKGFLTGGAGNSKTWYWAADKSGNIGLGSNVVAWGDYTWSSWFTSTAWHSDKLCMYDAEFVFSQSIDGEITFEQLKDIAYTPGDFAGSIGVAGDACHGIDVAPSLDGVKNVSFSPSNSIATIEGEYRGTTINFSDDGFMCWYVGVSSIEIIEITDSTLFVRMTDAANSDLAWYCKYQTDNPND